MIICKKQIDAIQLILTTIETVLVLPEQYPCERGDSLIRGYIGMLNTAQQLTDSMSIVGDLLDSVKEE